MTAQRRRKNFNLLGRKSALQELGEHHFSRKYPPRDLVSPKRPARVKKTGTEVRASEGWGRDEAEKALKRWKRLGYNPEQCARMKKTNVTDRAKRYRANQPGCRPAGVKKCKLCGSKHDVMVDHVDGNESNGRKSNLRWLCRSCNNTLGAEMARTGQGRRTVQYNPKHKGAQTLEEYIEALRIHRPGMYDEGGRIIHDTPAAKRQEYARQIVAVKKHMGKRNPSPAYSQYIEAVATLAGEGLGTMNADEAWAIVQATSKRKRSEYAQDVWSIRKERYGPSGRKDGGAGGAYADDAPDWVTNPRRNPEALSTEYRLGYNLGQMDRQTAALPKTWAELEATFNANFPAGSRSDALPFFEAYKAGYDLGDALAGSETLNPASYRGRSVVDLERMRVYASARAYDDDWMVRSQGRKDVEAIDHALKLARKRESKRGNPESEPGDESEEYKQALRTAELFHGRPVVEKITVTESIRSHDWHVRIGPLVSLKVRTVTKKNVLIPFHQTEKDMVHLFVSPDGRQFYLRGGDQELELDSVGMGPGSDWFRDQMLIGDAKEITYRDKKKFHKFKLTDYYHKLGEETGVKPVLAYDSLAGKLSLIGGQYRVETEDLVEDMSPGIVN